VGAKSKSGSLLDAIVAQGKSDRRYVKSWWETIREQNPAQYAELEVVCRDFLNRGKTWEMCGSMKELCKRLQDAKAVPAMSVVNFRRFLSALAEQ